MKIATPMTIAVLALAGCAGTGGEKTSPAALAAVTQEGVVLGALAEPGLPRGSCGMVLWTLDANRPAPVFRYISGREAEIMVAGVRTPLSLNHVAGASEYGVYEELRFSGAGGLDVSVRVRFSLGFDGGSYLERGLITIERGDGWRTVTPAAGLAGCRG